MARRIVKDHEDVLQEELKKTSPPQWPTNGVLCTLHRASAVASLIPDQHRSCFGLGPGYAVNVSVDGVVPGIFAHPQLSQLSSSQPMPTDLFSRWHLSLQPSSRRVWRRVYRSPKVEDVVKEPDVPKPNVPKPKALKDERSVLRWKIAARYVVPASTGRLHASSHACYVKCTHTYFNFLG
ncbi:hypothetical protein VE03_10054 [Pseudogymnoascus sp. 23342-1-I1]|nr:hypothetical protein VE03_10054 [Pseudogymnoascus sp. 23342-1-I1]